MLMSNGHTCETVTHTLHDEIQIFRHITCQWVKIYHCFRRMLSLHLQGPAVQYNWTSWLEHVGISYLCTLQTKAAGSSKRFIWLSIWQLSVITQKTTILKHEIDEYSTHKIDTVHTKVNAWVEDSFNFLAIHTFVTHMVTAITTGSITEQSEC